MADNVIEAVLKTEAEGEGEVLKSAGSSGQSLEVEQGLYRLLNGFKDKLSKSAVAEILKATGYVVAEPQVETPVEKSQQVPEEYQDIFKAQESRISKAEDQNLELLKSLNAEKDLRLTKEFVAKAESDYSNLGSGDDLGAILKSIHGVDKDLAESVEKVLKAANGRIEKGDLFSELGHGGGTRPSGAWDQISARAKEEISKSSTPMTKEQAQAKVMSENPELYEEFRKEQGGGLN